MSASQAPESPGSVSDSVALMAYTLEITGTSCPPCPDPRQPGWAAGIREPQPRKDTPARWARTAARDAATASGVRGKCGGAGWRKADVDRVHGKSSDARA